MQSDNSALGIARAFHRGQARHPRGRQTSQIEGVTGSVAVLNLVGGEPALHASPSSARKPKRSRAALHRVVGWFLSRFVDRLVTNFVR
jgi:hypothetical protein